MYIYCESMKRSGARCLRGMLAVALFVASAAAETRKPLSNPQPEYPEFAKRIHIAGTVKVEIVIAADGSIKSSKVLGGHPMLVEAVERALKKWKYAPTGSESSLELEFRFDAWKD